MPVVVRPADHPAKGFRAVFGGHGLAATTPEYLLEGACYQESKKCDRVIQSSFGDKLAAGNVFPATNGLVRSAVTAYNEHHHLTIRPEDVWFAVLTQMSAYINANAEKLRPLFVRHEGKKEIKVYVTGSIDTVDFGLLAEQLTRQTREHLVDPELHGWVEPDFTTTEAEDRITAAVIMMGSLQEYFAFSVHIECGIPSVTLLGEKADWEEIRVRVDKLAQFGEEPTQFAALLKPVLDNFIRTFDGPTDPDVLAFWGKIAHYKHNFSGPDYLSGWITAFCFWKDNGRPFYMRHNRSSGAAPRSTCEIDGVPYHRIKTGDIPSGSCAVPVTVDDSGVMHKTRMVAGSVGVLVTSSSEAPESSGSSSSDSGDEESAKPAALMDSLQPLTGWWIYDIADKEPATKKRKKNVASGGSGQGPAKKKAVRD